MQLHQQKHLLLKRKLPLTKHPACSGNNVRQKALQKPRNYKRISENTLKDDTQTIKYHLPSTDLKTIRNYPSSTET